MYEGHENGVCARYNSWQLSVSCMRPAQVQEKLAMSMMQEEEERMFDTMHEAEYRRMETRWG